jgi:short-subunit dehydrogenase
VITGCTDGIGKAYTEELARRGFKKFLLIGRNQQKLDDVSTILRTEHNVTTVETHIFDFSTDDWDKLPVHQLQTYDIGLLGGWTHFSRW